MQGYGFESFHGLENLEQRLLLSAASHKSAPPAAPVVAAAVPGIVLALDNATIQENGSVTLTGTLETAAAEAATVMVNWGDGEFTLLGINIGDTTFTSTHTYLDDAPIGTSADLLTVTATLRANSDGSSSSAGTEVTVENVAPVMGEIMATPQRINEDQTVTLAGSFTDPGTLDAHSVTVNWGDGSVETISLNVGDREFSATHQYLDDNPTGTASDDYAVSVTVADDDTGSASAATTVTVDNVAPAVTSLVIDPVVIDENGVGTLTGQFTDPGSLDTHTVTVDWGDGSVESFTLDAGARTFSYTHQYLDDAPSGTPSDEVAVNVTVMDDDTGTGLAVTTVTVQNVAPVVTDLVIDPVVINENDVATLTGSFTDPGTLDTHTVTIDWGDGTVETFNLDLGARSFAYSHQYLDDNPTGTPSDVYVVQVSVTDDDTGVGVAGTTITVNNVPPVIVDFSTSAPGVGDAAEGQTVTVTGSFTDVGTLDTHTAVIDWGDGTTSVADLTQLAGGGSFGGSHVYTAGGVYAVSVVVTDDDTGEAQSQAVAVVTGVGIHNGILQIIGSDAADKVQVNLTGKGMVKVGASFLSDKAHKRMLDFTGVTGIEMLLGDGNDKATVAGNVAVTLFADGGAGDDQLKAGRGPAVLLGSEGNDKLIGSKSGDLLIGGLGSDRIVGGPGGDMLTGGRTNLDPNDDALTIDFSAGLLDVLAKWNSGGKSAVETSGLTVSDAGGDKLTGASGNNWYFDALAAKPGKGNGNGNGNGAMHGTVVVPPTTTPGGGNGQSNKPASTVTDTATTGDVTEPVLPPAITPVLPGNGNGNGKGPKK